jgi:hypothetical protein
MPVPGRAKSGTREVLNLQTSLKMYVLCASARFRVPFLYLCPGPHNTVLSKMYTIHGPATVPEFRWWLVDQSLRKFRQDFEFIEDSTF